MVRKKEETMMSMIKMMMMFQAKMVREKEKEGDELRANIAESNQESEANIEMKRRQTQNNIKVRQIYLR